MGARTCFDGVHFTREKNDAIRKTLRKIFRGTAIQILRDKESVGIDDRAVQLVVGKACSPHISLLRLAHILHSGDDIISALKAAGARDDTNQQNTALANFSRLVTVPSEAPNVIEIINSKMINLVRGN